MLGFGVTEESRKDFGLSFVVVVDAYARIAEL
jgi:hypothetical protein